MRSGRRRDRCRSVCFVTCFRLRCCSSGVFLSLSRRDVLLWLFRYVRLGCGGERWRWRPLGALSFMRQVSVLPLLFKGNKLIFLFSLLGRGCLFTAEVFGIRRTRSSGVAASFKIWLFRESLRGVCGGFGKGALGGLLLIFPSGGLLVSLYAQMTPFIL